MPSLFVILADRAGLQAVLAAAIRAPLSLQVPDVGTAAVHRASIPQRCGSLFLCSARARWLFVLPIRTQCRSGKGFGQPQLYQSDVRAA